MKFLFTFSLLVVESLKSGQIGIEVGIEKFWKVKIQQRKFEDEIFRFVQKMQTQNFYILKRRDFI